MTKRNASNKIMEGLGNLAHAAEQDHEVQMARAQLYKLAKYSIQLHDKLKSVSEAEGLEGWVQAKITKSADMISNVFHHLDYQEVDDEPMMDLDLPAQEMAEGINHATKYFQVSARANFYNGKRYEDGLSIFYIQAPDEAGAKELANQNIGTITDMFKSKKLRSGKPELRKNDNVPVRIGRIKELTGSFRTLVLTSAGQFERITHDGSVAEGKQKDVYKESLQNKLTTKLTTKTK